MTQNNPTSGTEGLLPDENLRFSKMLLSLTPDDKRAMARRSEEMAREAETPESAAVLYELADLMRRKAEGEDRAIKALGLLPGEGLA